MTVPWVGKLRGGGAAGPGEDGDEIFPYLLTAFSVVAVIACLSLK
jgi:hypothetical protein